MSNPNVVIRPEGSIDVNSSEALRREIVDSLKPGVSSILLDCQDVTFMDSSGLSAVVMALKLSREADVRFSLCSVGEQVGLVFDLTGINKVLDIFEDRAAFEQTTKQPA